MASQAQTEDMKTVLKYYEAAADKNAQNNILMDAAKETREVAKAAGKNIDMAAAITLTAAHFKEVYQLYGNDAAKMKSSMEHSGVGFLDNVVVPAGQTRLTASAGANIPHDGSPAYSGTSVDASFGLHPVAGVVNQVGVSVDSDAEGKYKSTTIHTEVIPVDHFWATAAATFNKNGDKVLNENLGLYTSGHIPGTQKQDFSLYGAVSANQHIGGATPAGGNYGASLVLRADAQVLGDAGKTGGVDVGVFAVKGLAGNSVNAKVIGGEIIYTPIAETDFDFTLRTTVAHDLDKKDTSIVQAVQLDF